MATISVDATPAVAPTRPPHSELLGHQVLGRTRWDRRLRATRSRHHRGRTTERTSTCPTLPRSPSSKGACTCRSRGCSHAMTALCSTARRSCATGARCCSWAHSGAGKSTLAVSALEAGWQALADDVVIVHPDARRPLHPRHPPCSRGADRDRRTARRIRASPRRSAQPRHAPPHAAHRRWAPTRGRRAHHARRRGRAVRSQRGDRSPGAPAAAPVVCRKHRSRACARRSSKPRVP